MSFSDSNHSGTTLVATLGGQPQIVTFLLDLLLARGERVEQVVVVYPARGERYARAQRVLAGEFAGDRYRGGEIRLRCLGIRRGGELLAEVRTPEEVEAVRAAIFDLLAELKDGGRRVHLGLSGGRRVMALVALAAAMQYLTPEDRVWHLYTPPDVTEQARDGRMMHAPPDAGLQLIPVPFVPWAAYFPGLKPLLGRSPQEPPGAWLAEGERARCRAAWEQLTRRQRETLQRLAAGDTRHEAARALGIATSTLDSHRNAILDVCVEIWQGTDTTIDLDFLRSRFGPFLAGGGVEGV